MHEYVFRWTQEDHVRAQRAVTRHMIGGTWIKVLPIATIAVILFLVVYVLISPRKAETAAVVLPYALVLALVSVSLRWWAPRFAARRVAREDPSVKGEIRHTVSDSGFKVRGLAASVDLTWEHLAQVVETPEFFLYYYTKQWAYYTPKRAIPVADLAPLRDAIRSHVGDRARLLGDS